MRTWIRILILADPDPHFNMCGSVIPDSCSNLLLVRFSSVQVWRFLLSPEQWAGAGTFLVGAGAGVYEEEPEPVKKITWSRSRSKVDRLRNTAPESLILILEAFLNAEPYGFGPLCRIRNEWLSGSESSCNWILSVLKKTVPVNPPLLFSKFLKLKY